MVGHHHSLASSDYDETNRRTIANIEVGVIVGTISAFVLVIFFLFYFRHVEERRKATLRECQA
jgi:hypothetical protein